MRSLRGLSTASYAGFWESAVASLHVSRDGGFTWDGGDTSWAGGSKWLRVAASENGALVAVYILDFELWSRTSFDQGRTWTAPVSIAVTGDPALGADLEVLTQDGGLTAVRANVNLPSLRDNLRVAASPDHGLTWGPAVGLDSRLSSEFRENLLAMDETTVVYGWRDDDRVFTRRTTDAGASWDPAVQVNEMPISTLDPSQPSLGTSGGGHFQVAYFTPLPHELRVAVSTDGAATWPGNEQVVGDADNIYEAPQIMSPDPGEVLVGGWHQSGEPGVAVNLSGDDGFSWLGRPSTFAPDGVGLHHVRFARGPVGTIVAAHDDYRFEGTDCPPDAGGTCESIFMQRSCNGVGPWEGPEVRLDRDGGNEGPHSEDPEIVTDSENRIQVLWVDNEHADGPILHHAVVEMLPASLQVRQVRAGGDPCLAPDTRFELDPSPPPGCPNPSYQWYRDGDPIPGSTGASHTVPGTEPSGPLYHVEVECGDAGLCGAASEPQTTEPFEPPDPPEEVGMVLFATWHGPTAVTVLEATFAWTGDRGAPRPPGSHYHVARGTLPWDLRPIPGIEPHLPMTLTEGTPSTGAGGAYLHFYEVVAANVCEEESAN